MTEDEKNQQRSEIKAFLNPPKAEEAVPLPASVNRATLTPDQQETLFNNWTEFIYNRPSSTWTPEEKAVITFASRCALRGL